MLRSHPAIRAAALMLLAIYGSKYQIKFIDFQLLSNHYHLIFQDVLGNYPDFMRDFNAHMAKCINRINGTTGQVWSGDGYFAIRIADDEGLVQRMQYLSENALAAGLVKRMRDYPNLWIRPADFERDITVILPECLATESSKLPQVSTLRFHRPPSFEGQTAEEYRQYRQTLLSAAEARHDARRKLDGTTVVGATKLRRQRWSDEPAAKPVRPGGRVLKRRVDVLARCPQTQSEFVMALAEFRARYRSSLSDYRDGIPGTKFPPGTWKMRREHRVEIEARE